MWHPRSEAQSSPQKKPEIEPLTPLPEQTPVPSPTVYPQRTSPEVIPMQPQREVFPEPSPQVDPDEIPPEIETD